MRSMRHPNPLIDVRRPRRGEKVGVNPPGFIWKPLEGAAEYRLEVCRSRKFDDASLQSFTTAGRTIFLLPEPLEPGRWFWRWLAGDRRSETFDFRVLPDAAAAVIGSEADLSRRAGQHPRLMVAPGGVEDLRRRWKTEKAGLLAQVVARAEELLKDPHEMAEPPWLPPRSEDYAKTHVVWRQAMHGSRVFCAGARDLAFAWLVSGDPRFAEAVALRLDSLSRWDPDGSTHIRHNDEPHMSVINWCPWAFDWTYDVLPRDVRERFARHLARRGENTLAHLARLDYHVNPFSNHAGRMIGFTGHCGLALAGHDDRAAAWLRYILELMVTMYPVWGRESGGWAQGHSYGGAYVRWILEFLFSLRTALGIDLYRKPFFRSHGRWWLYCLPEWSWQTPFGDGSDREAPLANAAIIALHLGKMQGDAAVEAYGERCLARLVSAGAAQARFGGDVRASSPVTLDPLVCLAEGEVADVAHPPSGAAASSSSSRPGDSALSGQAVVPRHTSERFDDVGWVAMRRNFLDEREDISLVFKSSPYGPVSHSHGDQNAFVLSAWGKPLLIRTGYYTGYGAPHHQNWIRQTKAHNNVTVGGTGQWVDCFDAVGRIAAFRRGRDFAYALGDASAAYGERMTRFHRHVLFVGRRYFLIVDDLASPVGTTFDWHLHALDRMETDQAAKHVRVTREGATLDVEFVTDWDLRFYQTDQFDAPNDDVERGPYPAQWHFRATTVPVSRRARVGMLLIPNRAESPEDFRVERSHEKGLLRARVEHAGAVDEFLIATGDAQIACDGKESPALALWVRDGRVKFEAPRRAT